MRFFFFRENLGNFHVQFPMLIFEEFREFCSGGGKLWISSFWSGLLWSTNDDTELADIFHSKIISWWEKNDRVLSLTSGNYLNSEKKVRRCTNERKINHVNNFHQFNDFHIKHKVRFYVSQFEICFKFQIHVLEFFAELKHETFSEFFMKNFCKWEVILCIQFPFITNLFLGWIRRISVHDEKSRTFNYETISGGGKTFTSTQLARCSWLLWMRRRIMLD